MWKIAVFVFLCLYAGLASAGRLPRSEQEVTEQDCVDESDCENCKFVRVNGVCHKMATESHNECEVQEQCAAISSSLCIGGVCLGQKGLGEPCESSAECTADNQLICNSGTCECPLGNVQFGDTCLLQAGALGEECVENIQCEGVTGICSNGTCQAKGNSVILCNDENAEMEDEGCRCRDGFIESDDGKSCLKEAEKFGENCSITRQCEAINGTCTGRVCTEVIHFTTLKPIVSIPILLGSDCSVDVDCSSVSNSVCKESICQCMETHIPSEDASKCLPFSKKTGDACEIDKQCSKLTSSTCIGGKCSATLAAGMKTRKNGTSSPFSTYSRIVITTIFMIGSRAIFA